MKFISLQKIIILLFAAMSLAHAGADDISDLIKKRMDAAEKPTPAAPKLSRRKILIEIDYTEEFKLKQAASQIVIGNPIVADVKVKDDKSIFLIGKSPGRTNMLVYNRDGELSERNVLIVRDPTNLYVTLQKGPENRMHFDCIDDCQRVLRIEDQGDGYQNQISRIQSHTSIVQNSADNAKNGDIPAPDQGN